MTVTLADWEFRVNVDATATHSMRCSVDHCLCAYCRNYYETVDLAHPTLRPFLERFGLVMEGPSEVMPLEPTLVMAGYRVLGEIVRKGEARMHVDNVPIHPVKSDDGTFLLWVGEMELPWIQDEPMEDVVSPANLPEFMDRMREVWLTLHSDEFAFS